MSDNANKNPNNDLNDYNESDLNLSKKRYELNVLGLFQADAGDIAASRVRARYLHKGGNIRSAGDEVESAVREYYRRRLPTDYSVHHGHFLDKNLSLSSQMDLIIADASRFPIFFRGQEGMEYVPYEGVYAFGEIKSSLTNANIIDFVNQTNIIFNKLQRANVSNGYIDTFCMNEHGGITVYPRPERGDIYRFIFGVTSKTFNVNKCLEDLCNTDPRFAPNAICMLDKGIITSARAWKADSRVDVVYVHPQKKRDPIRDDQVDGWAFIEPENDYKEGSTLFYAYALLLEHLKNAVLLPANYLDYMEGFFGRTTRFMAGNRRNND
ncbi:DUF6602 domain-containing protein [Methylobacterium terrae]|uniref:DUF6602 domain-containing protein n=1 Tax=Methylobacterium terrae TaxID=2202827 RepID=UPI0013A585F2|nr:DUF6602 domain-containing protein [Methylobacterium terrae]